MVTLQGFTSEIISVPIIAYTQPIASFALEPNQSSLKRKVIDEATGQPVAGTDVVIR